MPPVRVFSVAVYVFHPLISPICWQVAQSMVIALDEGYLSEKETRQYTAAQWAVRNLYDNILIHLKKLQKVAEGK
jgi:hypothetical protein